MKELSIKEKAKAYDEALKRAIAAHKDEDRHLKAALERIFPELKESEDERIRNQIINFIEEYGNPIHCEWQKDWIAWLEKQDKQNPCESCEEARLNCQNFPCERKKNFDSANKVKPKKFKVGDWVVLSTSEGEKVVQIDFIDYFKSGEPSYVTSEGRLFDNGTKAHLWTINDAKDGDILVTENKNIFIFKSISDCTIYDYFRLYFGKFSENFSAVNGKVAVQPPTDCVPATKEQRDTLMKAMADAGYTFDFEKKELKKL